MPSGTTTNDVATTKKKRPKKSVLAFRKCLRKQLGLPETGYKDQPSRTAFSIMRFVEEELVNLPHHKPTSRTHKRCFNLFKEMLEGKFVTKRRPLVLFVRARKLPKEIQIRKFTVQEIKTTLRRLDMYVKNSKFKSYSLADFLYTTFSPSGTVSLFLLLWDDRRWESVAGSEVASVNASECAVAMKIAGEYLGVDETDKYSWNRTHYHITHLQNFYHMLPEEDIDEAPYGFTYFCPNFIKFVEHYIHHLASCDWITFKSFNLLSLRSNFFRNYMTTTWDKSSCGYPKALNEYVTEYIIFAFISDRSGDAIARS
jgi:hypothetical protein